MKWALLICVWTIFLNSADAANWVEVSNDPKNIITYMDVESIRAYGNSTFSAWSKWLNKKPVFESGKKVWYMKTLDLYDCRNNKNRPDSVYSYGFDDSPISIYTRQEYEKYPGAGFSDVVPETFSESMKKSVCLWGEALNPNSDSK